MDRLSSRFWYLKAFGIFLIALSIWIGMAIFTGVTFGAELSFVHDLRSHLLANYGEESGMSMRYLSLTILGDIFSDQDISSDAIETINSLLEDPVPTATLSGGFASGGFSPTSSPTPGQ